MKKTIVITIMIITMSLNGYSQLLHLGIKAGLNYADLTGTNVQTNAITSYHAGLVAEIKLLDKFSIQPELLYSTQGATYKTVLGDVKNELGYIAIPVMAKIYLNNTISLELGPQASFLLSQKNNFDANNSNTFDFTVAAGLGIKVTKSIFIQGRYGLGLTEVSSSAQTKNSVVQVSAGLMF
ncbi:porin family protein [Flavobacterium sp.]|uniref:porin family protein n=1 Tax=Flavobacterium sp. TaxID=239 RepID=UPI00378E8AE1